MAMLNDLAAAADVFIPSSPLMLSVLQSGALRQKPRGSVKKPPQLALMLRCPKTVLETKVCKDRLTHRALALLHDYFAIYQHSIAFPELMHAASVQLRGFIKSSRVQVQSPR